MGIRRDTAAKSLGMRLRESATSSRTAARVDFMYFGGETRIPYFSHMHSCAVMRVLNFISYILYLIQTRSPLLT